MHKFRLKLCTSIFIFKLLFFCMENRFTLFLPRLPDVQVHTFRQQQQLSGYHLKPQNRNNPWNHEPGYIHNLNDQPVTKNCSSVYFPLIPHTKYNLLNNYYVSDTRLEAVFSLIAVLRSLIHHFGSMISTTFYLN